MSVRSISLQKLIIILFSPANRRVSEIRKYIREDMKRSQDATAGGGDFLRALLSQNVSGRHLTKSDDWRIPKAVYTADFGLARGRKGDLFIAASRSFKLLSEYNIGFMSIL